MRTVKCFSNRFRTWRVRSMASLVNVPSTLASSQSTVGSQSKRVLSKQWQGEFCRCLIDVVGSKQCDGRVDHVERFRHHTGASAKAGKPMAQTTVDPLDRHRFILADIMPPNRQERVVRRIIVGTVQRDA